MPIYIQNRCNIRQCRIHNVSLPSFQKYLSPFTEIVILILDVSNHNDRPLINSIIAATSLQALHQSVDPHKLSQNQHKLILRTSTNSTNIPPISRQRCCYSKKTMDTNIYQGKKQIYIFRQTHKHTHTLARFFWICTFCCQYFRKIC